MYIFLIILIFIVSVLLVLVVLVQNPKSGMAANFGASNAVMGVRNTADFLEKFTWGLAVSIVVLSLAATMTMPAADIARSREATDLEKMIKAGDKGSSNSFAAPISNLEQPAAPAPTPAPATTPATEPAK